MKKFYLMAASLLVASTGFSQRAATQYAKYNFGPGLDVNSDVNRISKEEAAAARGNAFWTEDFANGMNSTNGMWTQAGTDQIWKHSFFNSSGEWSTGTPQFASTTFANGFMLFDADSSNFPLSPNYVDRDGMLMSPSIDCSNEASVLVTFQQNMRWCCSQLILQMGVSVDGGMSWTDYDVLDGLAVNAGSDNPDIQQVNITSVAAGQGNVMLRFSWSGVSHYYWAIDDINLSPAANDDLTLTETSYAGPNELEYRYLPTMQAHPFTYSGWVKNQGVNQQTGVTLNVSVDETLVGNVYTGSSNAVTVAAGAQADSIGLVGGSAISTVGEYTITYTVTQNETDENTADNELTTMFDVTDTTYYRGALSATGNLSNQGDAFEMGPVNDIYTADVLTSVTFVPGTNTNAGVIAYAVLYEIDATGNFVYVDQTNDVTITASMIGTEVTVPFNSPINLNAPGSYFVAIGHYGGTDALTLATGGSAPAQTVFFLDGTDNTWYYITTVPHVRMNLNSFVGVEDAHETGISLSQNMPNPTNGETTITYELAEANNVTLEIVDLTGKKVMEVAAGTKAAGTHQMNLNVNELAAGVYYYTLIAGEKRMTQKMSVVK